MQECHYRSVTSNFTSWTCLSTTIEIDKIFFFVFTGAPKEPNCEISCRSGNGPKDEETVDPDSIPPFNCSIKNGGYISRNMTWKEVNDKLTDKPGLQCLVLKSGNSVKRIFFASKCCAPCYHLWSYNGQNSIPNEYFVDPEVADEQGSTRLAWEKKPASQFA